MTTRRMFRHLTIPAWVVRKPFTKAVLRRIESAISASESRHRGELRFAMEATLGLRTLLRGETPRQSAWRVFHRLGMRRTAEHSGVLIYVQLVDRAIEIVADSGISARVTQPEWDAVCARMEAAFRAGRFEAGSLAAIDEVTTLLARHFPPRSDNPDELSNSPVVL